MATPVGRFPARQIAALVERLGARQRWQRSLAGTLGITTVHRTSIGGPVLVPGQIQSYRVSVLSGTARMLWY